MSAPLNRGMTWREEFIATAHHVVRSEVLGAEQQTAEAAAPFDHLPEAVGDVVGAADECAATFHEPPRISIARSVVSERPSKRPAEVVIIEREEMRRDIGEGLLACLRHVHGGHNPPVAAIQDLSMRDGRLLRCLPR